MTFRDLNLNKNLYKALDDLELTTPTGIQEKSFPIIMSGRDVVGIAQTGTGKTYAFLLPLLRLWKYSKERHPQILIIVPTRELVVQIVTEIEKLTTYMNFTVVGAYGGTNIRTQVALMELGMDCVVATPGRLLDLSLKGAVKLKGIKKFVVDEVDEMFNLGFLPQLKRVIDLLPAKRQNLLFSATMTEEVEVIIEDFFNSPVKVEAAPVGTPLENIDQTLVYVKNFNTKINLLNHLLDTRSDMTKVLVFTGTKKMADFVANALPKDLHEVMGVIHSNKSQNARFDAVNNFVSGEYRVLVATDIVARGVDVSGVSHVINFDVPDVPENYMHRIGRTGRADKLGNSLTFCTEKEETHLIGIEALMKFAIPLVDFPDEVEISNILTEDELPKIRMKNIVVKRPAPSDAGPAFHEKSAKNSKVNQKMNRAEKMNKKYGKPQTRGMKRKGKKK